MNQALIKKTLENPEFLVFAEGYRRAKEKYTSPNPGQLHFITNEVDAFLAWKGFAHETES